jgi:hypothetical protein
MSTDTTGTHLDDEEIVTTFPTQAQGGAQPTGSVGPQDADGTDGDGTDGVDGDSGSDADGTDGTDGGSDMDGTDTGTDADGTDA